MVAEQGHSAPEGSLVVAAAKTCQRGGTKPAPTDARLLLLLLLLLLPGRRKERCRALVLAQQLVCGDEADTTKTTARQPQ